MPYLPLVLVALAQAQQPGEAVSEQPQPEPTAAQAPPDEPQAEADEPQAEPAEGSEPQQEPPPVLDADGLLALCEAGDAPSQECLDALQRQPELLGSVLQALRGQKKTEVELLEALLLLLSKETGTLAVERLAALGDERAIKPLVHAARTRELPVATAAVGALARFERSLALLTRIVDDETLPLEVRQAAVESLGDMQSAAAADALVALLGEERRLPRDLRSSILTVIRSQYPQRAAEVQDEVTRRGTGWLMVGGAGALGYSLGAVGHFGQADLEPLGVATGVLAGGTLGLVTSKRLAIEVDDAAFLTASGLYGTTGGILVGCAVDWDDGCWIGGLLGGLAGYGRGALFMDEDPGTQVDAWEAMVLASSLGLTAGMGAASVYVSTTGGDPERGISLSWGLGLLLGIGAGQAVAPHVDLTGGDIGQMTLGATYGGFAGGLLGGDEIGGFSLWTGAGAGTMAAYGLAVPLELGGDAVFCGYAGLGLGSMVGLGTGMLISDLTATELYRAEDAPRFAALIGGSAGLGLAVPLAMRNPNGVRANDVVFTSLVTGWTVWQNTGWGYQLETDEKWMGMNFLVPAAVGSAAALASPAVDITVGKTLAASSLGLWGAYGGAVAADLAGSSDALAWSLVASDVGLGAGVLLLSPWLGTSPLVVGLADAGGVIGATSGGMIVALVTGDREPILAATLVGAGLGALGGSLAGMAAERKQGERSRALLLPKPRLNLPGHWSLTPATVSDGDSAGPGLALQVRDW